MLVFWSSEECILEVRKSVIVDYFPDLVVCEMRWKIDECIRNSLLKLFLVGIFSSISYGDVLIQYLIIVAMFFHEFYNQIKIFLVSVFDLMNLYSCSFHNSFSPPRWVFQDIIHLIDSILDESFCTIITGFKSHKEDFFIICCPKIIGFLYYIHFSMKSVVSFGHHFILSFYDHTSVDEKDGTNWKIP